MAEGTATQSRRSRAWIGVVAALVVLVLLVVGTVWLVLYTRRSQSPREAEPFSQYRSAWESAMAKAGVSATFPKGPVDLTRVRPMGSHSFSATFTGSEVSALLAVYRYRSDAFGDAVDLEKVSVDFPRKGTASLEGRATIEGSTYQASVQAPVSYLVGKLVVDADRTNLSVEGFSIGGRRRAQAVNTLVEYLNSMLSAAPGLQVKSAEIVEGGVRVEGQAPDAIEHPEPLPDNSAGALAAQTRDTN